MYPVTEECDVDICENGAVCKQLAGDYICECPPEFTGAICENRGMRIPKVINYLCVHTSVLVLQL